jgi:hypothetical protein
LLSQQTSFERFYDFGAAETAIQSSNPADLLQSITESTEFLGIKKFATDNSKYAD